MAGKSAKLAILMSAVQPGLGAVYAGEKRRGLATWLVFWILVAGFLWFGFVDTSVSLITSYLCLLLLVYLYLWSLIDAWRASGTSTPPSPARAGILSLLLPGLGQAYLGLYRRGWVIWGYVASAWTLMALTWELNISGLFSDISTILALSTGAAPILAASDAYKLARRARTRLA